MHQRRAALDTEWMDDAACHGWPTHLFFPARGELFADDHVRPEVKQVCAGCPVRSECLDYGLKTHSVGSWGGTSDKQRRQMRRGRKVT